jgi:uncharacterized SAM-binding protein YcdF (DUF218 family)
MTLRRLLFRSAVGVSVALGLTCAYVAWPGCSPPRPADAIVVLGSAVWPGEQPSPSLSRRIDKGVELWQAGLAPVLVPTGGVGANPPAEAEMMARAARAGGVPDAALVLERQAESTAESAVLVRALAEAHGWHRIILVSEPYHLRRSSLLFRAQGLEVQTACAAWGTQFWTNAYQTVREAGGLALQSFGLAVGQRDSLEAWASSLRFDRT